MGKGSAAGLPSPGPWVRDGGPRHNHVSPMDASQFESHADATLARLEQALEDSAGDGLDIELVGGN